MKLKLKNSNASSDVATSPSAAVSSELPPNENATPATKSGLGLKLKLKPVSASIAQIQNADTQKAKRKSGKKSKADECENSTSTTKPGSKKRLREDGDHIDSPATKRKSKPTAKSLAMNNESDDESCHVTAAESAPRISKPIIKRTPSIKISIKSGGLGALQRTGTAILKVKGAGKPPVRPYGVGYDSEADEAEQDPAMETQFILRMPPGSDCDLLRKSIEEKTIGKSASQGGPGVHFRFFDREGRRAMVTIQGRFYAASIVDLPTVIESLKSWNKKDWVKTADVCQMLLILGQVQNEEEAKRYPRPSYIDSDSHRFPHGLTPPMRWVRKRRFRPRKSYIDVERAEAQMNRLLAEDEKADSTRYEMVDSNAESSGEESLDGELEQDEEIANETQMNEGVIEEVDAGDLEQMLHAGFMEDEEVEVNVKDLDAIFSTSENVMQGETPTSEHVIALHTLNQSGRSITDPETAASTPAAATSVDDDDDDDDADSDENVEEVDEAAVAEEQRREQLRTEIAELEKAVAQSIEQRDRQTNSIFKKRMQNMIDKQKADLAIKLKQLNEEVDE